MHPLVQVAIKVIDSAGKILLRAIDEYSGPQERAKQLAYGIENHMVNALLKTYPQDEFICRALGNIEGDSGTTWLLDGIDSYKAFDHNLPQFCITMAVVQNGRVIHSLVYDVVKNELFTASKGKGAHVNHRRIRAATNLNLNYSQVYASFTPNNLKALDCYLSLTPELASKSTHHTWEQSPSLSLCQLASGRITGFWGEGLSHWELAAGSLMVIESGGMLSDFQGKDKFLESANVVAGTIKSQMLLLDKISSIKRQQKKDEDIKNINPSKVA